MRRVSLILTTILFCLPLAAQDQPTRVEFMEFKPAQAPCCNPYEGAHPEQP